MVSLYNSDVYRRRSAFSGCRLLFLTLVSIRPGLRVPSSFSRQRSPSIIAIIQKIRRKILCYSRVIQAESYVEKRQVRKYPRRGRKFISNHAQVVKNKWPGALTCPIKSRPKDRLFTRVNKQFISPGFSPVVARNRAANRTKSSNEFSFAE